MENTILTASKIATLDYEAMKEHIIEEMDIPPAALATVAKMTDAKLLEMYFQGRVLLRMKKTTIILVPIILHTYRFKKSNIYYIGFFKYQSLPPPPPSPIDIRGTHFLSFNMTNEGKPRTQTMAITRM